MSGWRHNICLNCWNLTHPGPPLCALQGLADTCCFCGSLNKDGIYMRQDPDTVPCKGVHSQ